MASKRLGPDDLIQLSKGLKISSSGDRASSSGEDVTLEDVDLPSDKQQLAEKLSHTHTTSARRKRQLQAQEYTIGWVCALPIELAAAREMLDEEHQSLPRHVPDSNIYVLGNIGEHNIVLVSLPAGQMGTTPAASVVARMQSTFSSIRFGLMVGIGGGVPSRKVDIRLGDVVVSEPSNVYGGVVQYDFGKAKPNEFERTGFLNSPPAALLNAVTILKANHISGRLDLLRPLSNLAQQPRFARDKAGPDVLYEATYNHEGGPDDCQKCRKEFVVRRQPRSEDVVVHYGTIASGNQVMRDATIRDRLSVELGGVLCFEMEAAGLMNSFPCLVVRGICDYADSHKNKSWQPYAAGTAAAFAKEILSVLQPAEVAETITVVEAIKAVNDLNTVLKTLPTAEEAPFNAYRSQDAPTCLPDTRINLLQEIHSWVDEENSPSIFWLSGLAGTGKSTVARTVAARYSVKESLGASFFFSRGGGDVSHAGKFVTSIAVQLAENVQALKPTICDAITKRSNIASLSLLDQWHHLVLGPLSKLKGNQFPFAFMLVVDALDECEDENSIRIILQLLAEARSLERPRLQVFLTSRPEVPIRHGFFKIPEDEHRDFVLHCRGRPMPGLNLIGSPRSSPAAAATSRQPSRTPPCLRQTAARSAQESGGSPFR